jgi:hypothetical protein
MGTPEASQDAPNPEQRHGRHLGRKNQGGAGMTPAEKLVAAGFRVSATGDGLTPSRVLPPLGKPATKRAKVRRDPAKVRITSITKVALAKGARRRQQAA